MATERVEMSGHIIDRGLLARVLDSIVDRGGDYRIERFDVGKHTRDESRVVIDVTAPSAERLSQVLEAITSFGARAVNAQDARLEVADIAACFPPSFYSTTNLPTQVRIDGRWVDVALPEMDCGIRIEGEGDAITATTVPMLDVRVGDRIVVGHSGVRLAPGAIDEAESDQPRSGDSFSFMSSDVSSEKPQRLLVQRVAGSMRQCREDGQKVLWVAGPALVHTGSVAPTVALIRAGYIDVLFAGNALPTHDIEASIHGTSLGVSQASGVPTEHGHTHHIRAINAVRRAGSIAQAVEGGVITSGIMHACVTHGVDYVLAGSVRDDGPLPDVLTDMPAAQAAMRSHIRDVGFCLVVCTMLHGIATGNLLPAHVPLVCVDINPATVTKLADRGSAQAMGIVTDVGLFVEELAQELAPDELADERRAAADRDRRRASAYA